MPRSTPALFLRIGAFTVATTILCLLILFLASSSLDPLIMAIAVFFYLASIAAMAFTIRHQFRERATEETQTQDAGPSNPSGETASRSQETKTSTPSAHLNAQEYHSSSGTLCLLLSRQAQTIQAVEESFTLWDIGLITAGSCAEASQKLLNLLQGEHNLQEVTLLIDTDNLEIDPTHLPAMIKQDVSQSQANIKFVGLTDQQPSLTDSKLHEAGYSRFLVKPIEKSLLFSAINSAPAVTDPDPNVVDLASYRQKTKRSSRKRILVADKNSSERNRLAKLLQDAGHRVKLVENGEQALDALERQRYDIALVNLELPIMNGTQVIKLHRFTTPHAQWVSFIIITDQTTPTTLRTCRELQVRACLFKPVPTDTLTELIDTAPVISLPASAMIEQVNGSKPQHLETQFLHADLLDIDVLKGLEHLDRDNDFVPDLIAIFSRDSSAILQRMEESVEFQDTKHFVELSNVLMDNAGQLGAFALYETCLALQRMTQVELKAALSVKLAHVRDLVDRTTHAFHRYLKEREAQHTDQN